MLQAADVGPSVLEFYTDLPFNMRGSLEGEAQAIRETNVAATSYPLMVPYLTPGARVVEIGCGVGWLSNAMAWHFGCDVTGVDFNPIATAHGTQVAEVLGRGARFVTSDLYRFAPEARFDVAVSNGVLHHTHDTIAGLEKVLSDFVAPGGVAMIGLYHLYGRKPFLDHFAQMRAAGASEDEMIDRYAQLHPQLADDRTHLMSWYRDQVCHPHETQHTLAEMLPVLEKHGFELRSTSINRFAPIEDLDAVLALEPALEDAGKARLAQNVYFPGFFLFLAQKVR